MEPKAMMAWKCLTRVINPFENPWVNPKIRRDRNWVMVMVKCRKKKKRKIYLYRKCKRRMWKGERTWMQLREKRVKCVVA